MKKLLLSLIWFMSFAAFGQVTTPEPLPTTPIRCLPQGLGAGTAPQVVFNEYGIAAGWWCKKLNSLPARAYVFALRYDSLTIPLVNALKDVLLTTSRLSAMENIRVNFAKADFYSEPMLDVWPDIIPAMLATKPL